MWVLRNPRRKISEMKKNVVRRVEEGCAYEEEQQRIDQKREDGADDVKEENEGASTLPPSTILAPTLPHSSTNT